MDQSTEACTQEPGRAGRPQHWGPGGGRRERCAEWSQGGKTRQSRDQYLSLWSLVVAQVPVRAAVGLRMQEQWRSCVWVSRGCCVPLPLADGFKQQFTPHRF